MTPREAVFTFRDCKTLFMVSVQVICQDENQNEIMVQKVECFYQNRNLIKAPSINGYIATNDAISDLLKNFL